MVDVDLRRVRLAVDLGASNVKMAWFEDGRIVDSSGRHVDFPAVVAVRGGDLIVGADAQAVGLTDPAAVLLDVREWLGYVPSVRLAGTEVRIDEAVTALYRAAARATVHSTDSPPSAIVHPASWPERRVLMLTAAARNAGLDVLHVVPDAVAVAAASPTEGDVLVIDVGASLTVSVIDATTKPPRVLWSQMSAGAGGEAIAHAIRAVTHLPVGRARQLARGAALHQSEVPLDWNAVRSEADEAHVAARDLINEVLRSSDRDGGDIARVYITGGASVAPFIREAARIRFGADGTDKVVEFAGPAASAAYGALHMCAPDRFPNVWKSVERRQTPRPWPEPPPERRDAAVTNEWFGPSEPSPAAASSTAWSGQPGATSTTAGAQPNAWDVSASTNASPSEPEQPASPSTASTAPVASRRPTARGARVVVIALIVIAIALALLLLALGLGEIGRSEDEPVGGATNVVAAALGM